MTDIYQSGNFGKNMIYMVIENDKLKKQNLKDWLILVLIKTPVNYMLITYY